MNISALFIRRPIATSLLMAGVLLAGAIAYPLMAHGARQVFAPAADAGRTATFSSPVSAGWVAELALLGREPLRQGPDAADVGRGGSAAGAYVDLVGVEEWVWLDILAKTDVTLNRAHTPPPPPPREMALV